MITSHRTQRSEYTIWESVSKALGRFGALTNASAHKCIRHACGSRSNESLGTRHMHISSLTVQRGATGSNRKCVSYSSSCSAPRRGGAELVAYYSDHLPALYRPAAYPLQGLLPLPAHTRLAAPVQETRASLSSRVTASNTQPESSHPQILRCSHCSARLGADLFQILKSTHCLVTP